MSARLVVTIDTEEEGLWGNSFRAHGYTVQNIRGVERFQVLCDRAGVKTTYLIDAPVVEDDYAVGLLGEIQQDGRGEVGAHLHPWCNPPFEEATGPRNSFLCNLPEPLQRSKLTWLTDKIEARFGRRPTSFRAGRYGLDIVGARILRELGYTVDSSVIPFTNYAKQHGPDFENAPYLPYLLEENDITKSDPGGFLLELPVSVGFNRANFAAAHRLRSFAMRPVPRKLRAVGILDRLGIVRRIKFSPEQADAAAMKSLVDTYLVQDAPCMVMMLHSSSLVPGLSPYVRTQERLDAMYDALAETFRYCLEERGMESSTLTNAAQIYLNTVENSSIDRVGQPAS